MQGDETDNSTHQPIAPLATSYSNWARLKILFVFGMCLSGAITFGGPLLMMLRSMGFLTGQETPQPSDLANSISSALSAVGIGTVCFATALIGYLFAASRQSKIRSQIVSD